MSNAGGKAYDLIRSAILSGGFAPGRRLKEDELTAFCHVSRTPVREALRRLALEGLVTSSPNVGAHVSKLSDEELCEIYVLRALVEGRAAARAATRIEAASIARLREVNRQMEEAVARRGADCGADFLPANAEFHRAVLAAAASPRLSAMAAMVVEAPLTVQTLGLYSAAELNRSIGHHAELVDAFEARDGAWAESVMKSHIQAAYNALARRSVAGTIRQLANGSIEDRIQKPR